MSEHCRNKRKASVSLRLHFNPASHAHTHALTFKMVKMVESADEFKALKMGDKPVRTRPGSARRSEDADVPRNEKVARVSAHALAGLSPRASRSWSQSSRQHRGRALEARARARPSRPTSNARARASPMASDPVDAAPIAKPLAV